MTTRRSSKTVCLIFVMGALISIQLSMGMRQPPASQGVIPPGTLMGLQASDTCNQVDTMLELLSEYCDVAAQLIEEAEAVDPEQALMLLEQYSHEIVMAGEYIVMLIEENAGDLSMLASEIETTVLAFWDRVSAQEQFIEELEDKLAEGLSQAETALDMKNDEVSAAIDACLAELLAASGGTTLPPPPPPAEPWEDFDEKVDRLTSIQSNFTEAAAQVLDDVDNPGQAAQLQRHYRRVLTSTAEMTETMGADLMVSGDRAGAAIAVAMTGVAVFDGAETYSEFNELAAQGDLIVSQVLADARAAHEDHLDTLADAVN